MVQICGSDLGPEGAVGQVRAFFNHNSFYFNYQSHFFLNE